MRRTSLFALALAFALAACDKTEPTPAGTVLVDASPTKLSVSPWSIGAPADDGTSVATTYRYEPGDLGDPIRFELAYVHGPVAFVDPSPSPGAPKTILAPRKVKITVVENDTWAMTGSCEDDLAVPLAVNPDGTSAIPASVWARCRLVMKRKNGDITLSVPIDVHGDGKIQPTILGDDHRLTAQ
jgi:hypothetical protein